MPNRTCTLPDCDKPYRSKGYCAGHYRRWHLYGDPTAGAPPRHSTVGRICEVRTCGSPVRAKGLCQVHYGRVLTTGRLDVVSDQERFWAKVAEGPTPVADPSLGPCWLWTAAAGNGYGTFYLRGRYLPAHRAAFEELRGEIPEGLHLDHLCRVPRCVNPWHLDPVTPAVNTERTREFRSKHGCPSCHCA